MNIISYSLFEPKHVYNHRFWDKWKDKTDRYWYNIPALVVVNSVLYPEFKVKLHISENVTQNPLYELLHLMDDQNIIDIEVLNYDYNQTEPTTWRYKPVFNSESEIVLCRDIDSLPTWDEYLATRYFIENDEFLITSVRSHTNHSTPGCVMLAGLCGFKTEKFDIMNFDTYYERIKNSTWGIDQNTIISIFASDPNITTNHFLDSPLSNSEHTVGNPVIPCISHREDFYRENVNSIDNNNLKDILNSITIWSGEPIDSRNRLNEIFTICNSERSNAVLDIIRSSEKLKDFYVII